MPRRFVMVLCCFLLLVSATAGTSAAPAGHRAFEATWSRSDMPVLTQQAARTWVWGPEARTALLWEPYRESPGGMRLVQYWDKSRMEITQPDGDRNSPWYVTNGLLVVELITGRLQAGDQAYELHPAATVPVAGDTDAPDALSYADLAPLLARTRDGQQPIVERLDGSGRITNDLTLAQWGAADGPFVPETGQRVASPFWELMTGSGLVYADGLYYPDSLFPSPFYATGLPITAAYWSRVRVGGAWQDVLVQAFERRVLTWTPLNPAGWQVEAGNVGAHYLAWRYDQLGKQPQPATFTTGDVRVTRVVWHPSLSEFGHEYVELTSHADVALDLHGWTLADAGSARYTFPAVTLRPGMTIRVHVAHGDDTASDLYWDRAGAVWNDGGDTATLRDAAGAIVSTLTYP